MSQDLGPELYIAVLGQDTDYRECMEVCEMNDLLALRKRLPNFANL
jgi:hypothetical protein